MGPVTTKVRSIAQLPSNIVTHPITMAKPGLWRVRELILISLYNFSSGFCQKRGEACSDVEIKPTCINITCKHNQYLCYPKGCISKDLACFGKCPNSGNIKMTSCGDKCIEESEAQGMYSCGETCLKKTQICNLGQKKNCSQHYNICGNECVERWCSIRIILDFKILSIFNSFTQALWESQTGLPLYHSCDGQCLNYSQPCDGHCGQGYYSILLSSSAQL